MHTVYVHGSRAGCSYLVALCWLHEQCLKVYCWGGEGGGGRGGIRHKTNKFRARFTPTHKVNGVFCPLITESSCVLNGVRKTDRAPVHPTYEYCMQGMNPLHTNTGVALASFQSDTQFTTRMRQNTIHGRLGKTSNKSVYEAYINEEQRHDKCAVVLHYKRSQKRKRRGGGAVKGIAHVSFFLLKLWVVSYKDAPLLVCFPANAYHIRHIQHEIKD